jgi:ketosteroid isomerase-like protein
MIDKKSAEHFAREWIDAWNSPDLSRILSHYEDDFEMTSPVIVSITGEPSGRLKGKEKVGAYWWKALQRIPNLRFELMTPLVG